MAVVYLVHLMVAHIDTKTKRKKAQTDTWKHSYTATRWRCSVKIGSLSCFLWSFSYSPQCIITSNRKSNNKPPPLKQMSSLPSQKHSHPLTFFCNLLFFFCRRKMTNGIAPPLYERLVSSSCAWQPSRVFFGFNTVDMSHESFIHWSVETPADLGHSPADARREAPGARGDLPASLPALLRSWSPLE